MDPRRTFRLEADALPSALRSLCPPCRRLYIRGRLPAEGRPRVAVVGSRTPSGSGRRVAYDLGWGLARAGIVVVSGMARGIDAAAHRGAADAGGITVAFLGNGVDVVYPRSHRELAASILERGALVSEYPDGTPPLPYHFVARNRLVAAYTRGTAVVEAGAKSGALITAGLALELGRDLWAVPGDPLRPVCRGSNRLVRDGAGVILDAGDLVVALGLERAGTGGEAPEPEGLAGGERAVWRSLDRDGAADAEALARRTGLPAARILEALSVLELTGIIEREGDGYRTARRTGTRSEAAPPRF